MGKRFTDTGKYKNPFMRSLPIQYKLLWDYMTCDCDNAGIWVPDFEVANIYIGTGTDDRVTAEEALRLYNSDEQRIMQLPTGRWWLIGFVPFQYRQLSKSNPAHRPVIASLLKNGLCTENGTLLKGLGRAFKGPMDKDKEKDMGMDEETEMVEGNPIPPDAELHQMYNVYIRHFPDAIKDRQQDILALGRIYRLIKRWLIDNGVVGIEPHEEWERVADGLKQHKFWQNKSLKSISNNLQTIIQEVKNGEQTTGKKGNRAAGRTIDKLAADILHSDKGPDS